MILPPKTNMSSKEGAISKGSFIFQPMIFRGKLLVLLEGSPIGIRRV